MAANLHHRRWDPHCTERTYLNDRIPAERMLAWIAKEGATILNDGSVTYSRPSRGLKSTPDITVATAATGPAKWKSVEDWGMEHRAIVTEGCTAACVVASPQP